MITAVLDHNPYLLETTIKFNNQSPRINSLVEKYQGYKLQSWIKEIPSIFHDEMNGYDFTLEFGGTDTDFNELKKSFKDAGVGEKQVRFVHKKKLSDRKDKAQRVLDLLDWLEKKPNDRFDFKGFYADHEELFDGAYPFILIQGRAMDVTSYDDSDIKVEKIDRVAELKSTELIDTPILFYLNRESLKTFQSNLRYVISRDDVIQEQIFFYIHPQLNLQKTTRLIQDLGIANPQIVSSIDDPLIARFMELYPYTDDICESIVALRQVVSAISSELDEQSKKSKEKHSIVHDRINRYDEAIAKIKNSIALFSEKDVKPVPEDWYISKQKMLEKISEWRKKKVKITDDAEAAKEAAEFNTEIQRQYNIFLETLEDKAKGRRDEYTAELFDDFLVSEIDTKYAPKKVSITAVETIPLVELTNDFKNEKTERYVEIKDVFAGAFFWQTAQLRDAKGVVKEVTYTYEAWRDLAQKAIEETADRQIQKYINAINQDYLTDCMKYLDVLHKQLIQIMNEKHQESKKLSGEEQKLQNDIDWLNNFVEQLNAIERG